MCNNIKKLSLLLPSILNKKDIITDSYKIAPYLKERRNNFKSESYLVVTPNNTKEIAKILTLCNTLKVEVVPLAGNTGLVGGGVANKNQIILSVEKLNNIRNLDLINQTITVEAGYNLQNLINLCAKYKLVFPLDLPSRKEALIGGNLATNAGGLNTIKYGQIRNSTLGLEVVLANGHIISDLNILSKRNIGPDYKHLFIGSEGILGVITAASFKLFPAPINSINILLSTYNIEFLIEIFLKFKQKYILNISAFEVINRNSVDISLEEYPNSFFPLSKKNPWYALITLDFYNSISNYYLDLQFFLQTLKKDAYIQEFFIEENTKTLWNFRDLISEAQKKRGKSIKHDIAIPLSNMSLFINRVLSNLKENYPLIIPIVFGHIGDQSLHFNLMSKNNTILNKEPSITDFITKTAMKYNGNFSAEHGIGLLHKNKLQKFYFNSQFYMLKLLKKQLDPNNILNPNKVIN